MMSTQRLIIILIAINITLSLVADISKGGFSNQDFFKEFNESREEYSDTQNEGIVEEVVPQGNPIITTISFSWEYIKLGGRLLWWLVKSLNPLDTFMFQAKEEVGVIRVIGVLLDIIKSMLWVLITLEVFLLWRNKKNS